MSTFNLFAVIILAALIHASFQLGVSLLTLLSGHALGAKTRHRKLMNLTSSFTLGAMAMTTLLLCAFAYTAIVLYGSAIPGIIWAVASGLLAGVGLAVWVFYYRHGTGTALWMPRPITDMLYHRVTATDYAAESFSLGITGVIGEIMFIVAPLIAASLSLTELPGNLQIVGVITYVLIASAPLVVITTLIGGGHRISAIQKWRENNKRFLQVAAGTALLVLSGFLYANTVLTQLAIGGTH